VYSFCTVQWGHPLYGRKKEHYPEIRAFFPGAEGATCSHSDYGEKKKGGFNRQG